MMSILANPFLLMVLIAAPFLLALYLAESYEERQKSKDRKNKKASN